MGRSPSPSWATRVDLIVTHECSGRLYRFLNPQGERSNLLGAFFDRVSESCEYRLWAFGSCHLDKRIRPKPGPFFRRSSPLKGNGLSRLVYPISTKNSRGKL